MGANNRRVRKQAVGAAGLVAEAGGNMRVGCGEAQRYDAAD